MNETRSNKGITLISLVVMIIILIILASVSINLLIGQNGLINRAKDAKIATEISSIKEEIQTDILDKQTENEGDISDSSLKIILLKYGTLSNEEKLIDKTLTTTKGSYKIKVSDIFNGTMVKENSLKPYALAEITGGANSPDISGLNVENTYYVTWGTTAPYQINKINTIDKAPPTEWSNYTEKQWANIVTSGGGNECYWVWIPRYAYKVPRKGNTAETIEVKFLQGKTNKPIGENQEITNTIPTPGTWVVHPAFTTVGNGGFGELTGIWVAKFEASSSIVSENTVESDLKITGGGDKTDLQVRVKPNVISWRGITVNNIFTVCRNLTETGNSLENTSDLNSHMMKNTEWGAVAYLSRSIYGTNGKVWRSPYYNSAINYSAITGLCGNESNGKDNATTDTTKTHKYNEEGGGNASTTGNVYGVYDMSGGAWECVAGILSGNKSNDNISKLYESNNSKYVDQYTNYGNTIYGDAVYETSSSSLSDTGSWDSTLSHFPTSTSPVFMRGLDGGVTYNASVFGFHHSGGEAQPHCSFRPVVLSSQQ